MIHSGTKCKQILCKLLSVFMFKRGASSLIHQAVFHWKLEGFPWILLVHCKKRSSFQIWTQNLRFISTT